MDKTASEGKTGYGMVDPWTASYGDKREGQPDYAAASVRQYMYGGEHRINSSEAADQPEVAHCCIL